jgi:hypothetical protein
MAAIGMNGECDTEIREGVLGAFSYSDLWVRRRNKFQKQFSKWSVDLDTHETRSRRRPGAGNTTIKGK